MGPVAFHLLDLLGLLVFEFHAPFCFLYLGKGENWSNENNKSVKWVENLHFLKHRTLDILIYKSCTFLVFEDFDSLCKFVIFSEHKSGDKIIKKKKNPILTSLIFEEHELSAH